MTGNELMALRLCAELAGALGRVVSDGPNRASDLAELLAHVHAIQAAVLSNEGARAHPGEFRLLGGEPPSEPPWESPPPPWVLS